MCCDINLRDVSFSFKEICEVAKYIKPDNWCIIASNQRLAFVEIILPNFGPATIQRQLIVNNYLQIEAYLTSKRICEDSLNLNNIKSVLELKKCLKEFASFGMCLGNRNFQKKCETSSTINEEYWRHNKCLLLYKKNATEKAQCCDMCLRLNIFLTRKQKQQTVSNRSSDNEEEYPVSKKIKTG